MKANKVPEKLYGCYKGNGNFFMDYRPFPNDEFIEYIRIDAFIEKAAKWLRNEIYTFDPRDTEKMIENFKKAMKL